MINGRAGGRYDMILYLAYGSYNIQSLCNTVI